MHLQDKLRVLRQNTLDSRTACLPLRVTAKSHAPVLCAAWSHRKKRVLKPTPGCCWLQQARRQQEQCQRACLDQAARRSPLASNLASHPARAPHAHALLLALLRACVQAQWNPLAYDPVPAPTPRLLARLRHHFLRRAMRIQLVHQKKPQIHPTSGPRTMANFQIRPPGHSLRLQLPSSATAGNKESIDPMHSHLTSSRRKSRLSLDWKMMKMENW
mmetsp:Transcript_43471/g.108160  ORF Transcript_43471/g.108160 Transcript_43471/m.108160 type:complete len:216 (-) Transcript_43471:212-859(-)